MVRRGRGEAVVPTNGNDSWKQEVAEGSARSCMYFGGRVVNAHERQSGVIGDQHFISEVHSQSEMPVNKQW